MRYLLLLLLCISLQAQIQTVPFTASSSTPTGGVTLNGLRGWKIMTIPSEYEWFTTTNFELQFLSMGPQRGPYGGDGLLKIQSNLTNGTGTLSSNASWLSWKGDLSAANDGVYGNRMPIILISLANHTISIGGTPGFNNSNAYVQINVTNTFWRFMWNTQFLDGNQLRIVDGGMTPPTINPDNAYSLSTSNFVLAGGGFMPFFPTYHNYTASSTNNYYLLGNIDNALTQTGTVFTNGNIRLTPFWSGSGGLIGGFYFKVAILGSTTIHYGLYGSQSPTNFLPGSLLFDSGAIDISATGVKITNLVTKIRLNPATVYYTAMTANDATVQVLALNSTSIGTPILGWSTNAVLQCGIESISIYGALPATCPLTNFLYNATGNLCPALWARFDAP